MRIGGAIGTAGLTAMLATRLLPAPYWGVALLGVSITLFELAWASLPAEMLIPAVAVNLAGISELIVEHACWYTETSRTKCMDLLCRSRAGVSYFLAARLLGNKSPDRAPVRVMAPWLGSVFTLAAIYMLLPTPYVCVAFGALAILVVEAGSACAMPNLIWNGRAASLLAAGVIDWLGVPAERCDSLELCSRRDSPADATVPDCASILLYVFTWVLGGIDCRGRVVQSGVGRDADAGVGAWRKYRPAGLRFAARERSLSAFRAYHPSRLRRQSVLLRSTQPGDTLPDLFIRRTRGNSPFGFLDLHAVQGTTPQISLALSMRIRGALGSVVGKPSK